MTHRQVLLAELREHGRTTYRELMDRYGDRGYTYNGFLGAVWHARKRGAVRGPPPGRRNDPIVKVDCCPMCGRAL
jgi:hypothetical protein